METWLRCTITPGQFSSEFGVSAGRSDGTGFSLFVPRSFVRVPREPSLDSPVEGFLRVTIWDTRGDLVLVRLPAQTFEGTHFVTVRAGQVETQASIPNPVGNP